MLASLDRPPESKPWPVKNLVAAAREGLIRVPHFQRGLRWDSGDVRQLLESIAHGYPIGTLLLWKKKDPAPAATVEFGPARFSVPQTSDAFWVVDGQQRTTALTATLCHPAPDPRRSADDFEFYYDLIAQTFVRRPARRIPPCTWLPLWEVVDSTRLLTWVDGQKPPLEEEIKRRAFRLATTIQEYVVPSVVVVSEDDRVLREIFRRINDAGRRLKQDEVFNALYAPHAGEKPTSLRQLPTTLAQLRFGNTERLPFRQTVLAMRDVDPTRSVKSLRLEDPKFSGGLEDATVALQRAIVFLKNDARMPVAQLVPYAALFPLLARFFQRFPEPNPRSRDLLARWVWRACVSGHLRGEVPKLRSAYRTMELDEEDAVQALLESVGEVADLHPDPTFDLRTTSGKLMALAMMDAHPKDLASGSVLDPHELFLQQNARPFERVLRRPECNGGADASEVGNSVIVGGSSHVSLQERLKHVIAGRSTATLDSHLIDATVLAALESKGWSGFVRARTSHIRNVTQNFLARRMRRSESDRPSLERLAAVED